MDGGDLGLIQEGLGTGHWVCDVSCKMALKWMSIGDAILVTDEWGAAQLGKERYISFRSIPSFSLCVPHPTGFFFVLHFQTLVDRADTRHHRQPCPSTSLYQTTST